MGFEVHDGEDDDEVFLGLVPCRIGMKPWRWRQYFAPKRWLISTVYTKPEPRRTLLPSPP